MRLNLLILATLLIGCVASEPPTEGEQVLHLTLELERKPVRLELHPTPPAVSKDFGRWRLINDEFVRIGGTETIRPECYYRGHIIGEPSSLVIARTCSGSVKDLEGFVLIGDKPYDLNGGSLRLSAGMRGQCATKARRPMTSLTPVTDESVRSPPSGEALSTGEPRFVEVAVFEDSALRSARSMGYEVPDPVLAVQGAALLYDRAEFDDRVLPLLTALVDTGTSDPWGQPPFVGNEIDTSSYLDQFNTWLESSTTLPEFDEATLLTGWDMLGDTVGLATVEGACDPVYEGALVNGVDALVAVSQVLAHELGHTIGMWHDGDSNNCNRSAYVMTAIYAPDGPYPTEFSTCSINDANTFLNSSDSRCIDRRPAAAAPVPRCGDGNVEGDEQCDCGPLGCEGRDPCCNSATCRLTAGATCSGTNPCCDPASCDARPASANVTCRDAASSCDVAEVCDGSVSCPADRIVPTGTSCTDGSGWDGACYAGYCATRGGVCESLSDSYVFDNPPYNSMCADAACGPMECLAGGACVYTQDEPPDGTPCGGGLQCYGGTCSPSAALPGGDGCATPGVDTDGDGTRDCDDECPADPNETIAPCVEPEPAPTNNGTVNGTVGSNNATTSVDRDDDIIILGPAGDGSKGCATTPGVPSAWLLLIVGLVVRRRLLD